ncbi:DUF1499 domain-containing protein [Plastorhodobacter daqingensis]|uniref:DUF1499 domain-containing protein n=1 Tax=Plastorhodobacter daqingensis TaxID=1387281 RepID=A0ABW2UNB8_9RHOB
MMRRLLLLLVVAALGGAAWVRLAPLEGPAWHVDPDQVQPPDRPNHALLRSGSVVYPIPPETLAAAVDDIAMADPRTRLLAGSVAEGHMTYVARSRIWGFPDLVTVRVVPHPDGATLAVFSRARFGRSDMGVNQARLDGWLRQLPEPL